MGIFREENHKIIISPECKLIPEFKALIARDKDKEKRVSFQEMSFVYFVTDYKSPYCIYPKEERVARVKRELGLDADWKPDNLVNAACEKYNELQRTPSISSLVAIRESLLTSTRVIETLRSRIDESLTNYQDPPEDGEQNSLEDITEIVTAVSSLLVLADKLPKAINTIEDLEEKVKKEQSNEKKIRGGGNINQFED
jgi:hypothetical protein